MKYENLMRFTPIILLIALLLMGCGNKSRHEVPPSSYDDSKREEAKKLEPYKIKGAKEEALNKEPAKSYSSSSKSGSSSYSSSKDDDDYDNMRGFDPASEDDMDDNGMSRYMANNDEEGWN